MTVSTLTIKPSQTALTIAGVRALASLEEDPNINVNDSLAQCFLSQQQLATFADPKQRRDAIGSMNVGSYGYLIARTKLIDQLFCHHLKDGTPQIVLIGAGFDTRAWRFRELNNNTNIFELDLAPTQQWKLECLTSNNGQTQPKQLKFIPTTFNLDSLAKDLLQSGYRADCPTFFIWEGVTPYLNETAVSATLEFVCHHAGPTSQIVFDYIYKDALQTPEDYIGLEQVLQWAEDSGEPFSFGIPKNNIEGFLLARGLKLLKHYSPEALVTEFLQKSDGTTFCQSTSFYCLAHAST